MPDQEEIIRTIYKLEIDSEGYIRGVESLTNSTQKFSQAQEQANQKLKANESELKTASDITETARKRLETYTGTNEKYRRSLELNLKKAQDEQARLNNLVTQSRKDYEAATKAAQDFANTSQRAANLQPAGGGRIPVPTVATPPQAIPPIIPPVAFEDFDLAEILRGTVNEFDQLRIAIGLAEQQMQGLNEESDEFKQLKPLVEQGKKVLQEFDGATKSATGSQRSIREQLRLGREELVRLEQAGQGATEQYFQLEKQVARLTDEFQDQQQRIRILASDTKLLDFGKGAITAATSAFQAYTAVSILAGDESEELQKKTMQLFAAMQLLQSLEQLSNLTRREGVLSTLALSGATKVYNTVIGTATGTLRTFRLALLATGIGAAVVAIGFLVKKYQEMRDASQEASDKQKLFKEINEEVSRNISADVSKLELFRSKLVDLSIPQAERVRLAKEYNKTADESAKIDLKQIDNIDLLNEAINRQISQIEKRAIATAREAALTKRAGDVFLEEERARERALQSLSTQRQLGTISPDVVLSADVVTGKIIQKTVTEEDRVAQIMAGDPQLKAAKERFQRTVKEVGASIKIEDLITVDTKTTTTKAQEIKSAFERRRAELIKSIEDLQKTEFDTEIKIRQDFAVKLKAAIEDINKDKSLKPAERKELIQLTTTLNTGELDKELEALRKKRIDAQNKLNDELLDIQTKNQQDQLNLIQDEFEKRAALIEFNEKQELQNAKEAQDDRLAALDLNRLLIGEQNYQDAKAEIIQEGEQQALLIQQRFAQQRQDLAADSFQRLLQAYDDAVFQSDLVRDKQILADLQVQLRLYQAGTISFQEFQDAITKIQKDALAEREAANLQADKNKLAALDEELKKIEDKYSEHYKNLKKQRDDLDKKITEAETKAITGTPDPTKPKGDGSGVSPEAARIIKYADAIGELANSVIGFWQQVNEAERAALDRSITIQEERVSAAQRIAERGNASYLKAEEDRLRQLQIARENAARRDLAINAALQASQVLVAITGAVAKIANPVPGAGIAETISSIAVIVAGLATGYALVKSLQGNQPRLRHGTTDVKRTSEPPGIDTIPAWLTEGEAVIPQEKNKKYKKSVEAIYHGKVPAEVLNEFVENYVTNKHENITKNNTVVNRSTSDTRKHTVEDKTFTDVEKIIHQVINETTDKKLSISEVRELLKSEKIDKKYDEVKKIAELVTSKIENEAAYSKEYSEVIDKVFYANKSLVEKGNVEAIVHKVINDISDKKVTLKEVKSFISNKREDLTLNKNTIDVVNRLLEEKIKNDIISTEVKNKLVNENISLSDIQKYSDTVNKVVNTSIHKKFTENIRRVPERVLEKFINTQYTEKINRYSSEILRNMVENYEHIERDNITIERVNKLDERTNKLHQIKKLSDFNKSISVEQLNRFIDTYHSIKPVPLPNYERIKDVAEIKISHDGKLAGLIAEQNKKLDENTEVNKQMLRAMKTIGVHFNWDKNGVELSLMEALEKREKDKRV